MKSATGAGSGVGVYWTVYSSVSTDSRRFDCCSVLGSAPASCKRARTAA